MRCLLIGSIGKIMTTSLRLMKRYTLYYIRATNEVILNIIMLYSNANHKRSRSDVMNQEFRDLDYYCTTNLLVNTTRFS